MDVAEQPRIVFESHTRCDDSHRAEELLRQVLARARAPGHAWVVAMRISVTTPGVLHGEGEITSDNGAAVGRRVFSGRLGDCSGLASAVGIWASLVLDAEVKRPPPVATADGNEPASVESRSAPGPEGARSDTSFLRDAPVTSSAPADRTLDGSSPTEWSPGAAPSEKTSRREEPRTLELGAGGFLLTGSGGGLIAGVTPFLLVETAKGVFFRPALALGTTLPGQEPVATLAASRLEGCLRLAGLYTSFQGMQFDICGGADLGLLISGRAFPYMALGPSVDLRGELGGDLAVTLRGLFGVNAIHEASLDTPLWAGRGEIALSWSVR